MHLVDVSELRTCLAGILASMSERKEKGDAPAWRFFSDTIFLVQKALIHREVRSGYPAQFTRVELLEQAAKHIALAREVIEAPPDFDTVDLEAKINAFRTWNSAYIW